MQADAGLHHRYLGAGWRIRSPPDGTRRALSARGRHRDGELPDLWASGWEAPSVCFPLWKRRASSSAGLGKTWWPHWDLSQPLREALGFRLGAIVDAAPDSCPMERLGANGHGPSHGPADGAGVAHSLMGLWIIGVNPVPGAGGGAGAAPCPVPAALDQGVPNPPGMGTAAGCTPWRGMGWLLGASRNGHREHPGMVVGSVPECWDAARILGFWGPVSIPGYRDKDPGTAALRILEEWMPPKMLLLSFGGELRHHPRKFPAGKKTPISFLILLISLLKPDTEVWGREAETRKDRNIFISDT